MSGHRSPRVGGGRIFRLGGRNRNGEGRTSGEPVSEKRTTATAVAKTAQASVRQGQHEKVSSDGVGGEYRARGESKGEIAKKSAGWSGEESAGAATDEDETATEGVGLDGKPWTETPERT